jgi:hypothetical protein
MQPRALVRKDRYPRLHRELVGSHRFFSNPRSYLSYVVV